MAAHRIPAINQFPPSHALHMNVAQFAAVGVVSKEWLFRITRRKQSSPVLLTNAYHHRSRAKRRRVDCERFVSYISGEPHHWMCISAKGPAFPALYQ